jgi:hypothetical protein
MNSLNDFLMAEVSGIASFADFVTSHYPQVAAARIKSDNGGILLSPSSLSLR